MQLSGGLYSYNRFDAYEEALKEGSGASDPKKMKKAVEKASKRAKGRGVYLDREDEKEEREEEVSTAEGGMSEEYKDITKPSKLSGVSPQMKASARASRLQVSEPGSKREKTQTRRSDQLNKLVHSGANMARRNEEVESFFIEDEDGNIYEGKKDACYHKVKSRYDVWPSAYASGALVKCRRAGAKNWGNSSKKEMFDEFGNEYVLSEGGGDLAQRKLNKDENNSKLKVTKKIMENDQRMAMYSRALGVMGAHYNGFAPVEKKEEEAVVEGSKPDYLDFDKDGDKKEPMKKALKEKGSVKKEEVELTKDMVVEYLVNEGYASNEVSAEILHTHISDEFLAEIEEMMMEGDADQGVSGDEAMKRHNIKKHEGPMKVTKLAPAKKKRGQGMQPDDGHVKMSNPRAQKPGADGSQNPGGKPVQG